MRLVFAGTPEFAATVLSRLLEGEHQVAAVYTQPDRPSGRGRRLTASPVKQLAGARGVALEQPATLRGEAPAARLRELAPDVMVVAAYGLILPPTVLAVPPGGCVNVHASLLPRWRGAAPIQRAIEAGDDETGVSIMRMEAGLDTGPVYQARRCRIHARDTAGSLHDRLAALGAEALCDVLSALAGGRARATPQPDSGVTHARRIDKEEAWLDFSRPARVLERAVRAFDPFPVAATRVPPGPAPAAGKEQRRLRVWSAAVGETGLPADPGTVLGADATGLDVATGDGVLRLLEVQPSGGRRMRVSEYLNARPLPPGARLG